MIRYEVIHKQKIEYRLQERYQQEIKQLEALGFHDLYHTREVVFPFSALFLLWLYPILKMNREVLQIEMPLRYVLLNPLLLNREYDTYAHVFGLGTKFATLFADNTMLITTNYSETRIVKPELKIYHYSLPKLTPLGKVWNAHIDHIADIETKGRETNSDLSIENFEKIMLRDDKALLFGR
ncbi:MAG: hypothetical protein H6670_14160 [Anaerolineaceae bacterium]|nr:hypothetical protein [Anaerolineaceae bacterium]